MAHSEQLASLSPSDAVATLRSLPRRFATALAPIGPDDPIVQRAQRVDATGWSALEHLVHATRDLEHAARSVEQVFVSDEPVLHPATMDDDARAWPPHEAELSAQLTELTEGCASLIARIEHVDAEAWQRTAQVDGVRVQALDLVRHTVGSVLDHLAGVTAALEAAR